MNEARPVQRLERGPRLKQGGESPREGHLVLICEPGLPPLLRARTAFSSKSLPPFDADDVIVNLDHVDQRLKVGLAAAVQIPSRKLGPLAARIAETPSKDRQGMLAKVRVCAVDPDMAEVSEGIAMSIAHDFGRLSAAGLI